MVKIVIKLRKKIEFQLNARRDANDSIKNNKVSDGVLKMKLKFGCIISELTDKFIKEINDIYQTKEKEILI